VEARFLLEQVHLPVREVPLSQQVIIAVKLQTQKYIAAGNHIKFEFTKGATCIDCVEFDAMRTLGKTTTTIEQLKERSVLAPTAPPEKSLNTSISGSETVVLQLRKISKTLP